MANANANQLFGGRGVTVLVNLNVDGVDIVTDGDIVTERNRFVRIGRGKRGGAGWTDENYSGAIMHQNVRNVRIRKDLNMNIGDNPQLTAIQEQLTELRNTLTGCLDGMIERLDILNTRAIVDRLRAHNRMNQLQPPAQQFFRPIIKYNVGHPFQNPPAGARRLDIPQLNVVFAPPEGGYLLGSNPPDGLLPHNRAELLALGWRRHGALRRFLRAVFWFYNNPELQLAAQAGVDATLASFDAFSLFLVDF